MSLPETNEGKILSDAWDYKGRPAEKSKTGGWTSAAMILGPHQALPCSVSVTRKHPNSIWVHITITIHLHFFFVVVVVVGFYRGGVVGKVNNSRNCSESGDLLDRHHALGKCCLSQHCDQLSRHLFHALLAGWLCC